MRKLLLILPVVLLVALAMFRRPAYDPAIAEPLDPDLQAIMASRSPADPKLVFLGDSITNRWHYRPDQWERLAAYRPANLGIGGDRVGNVLWRVRHGELASFRPDTIVLLIGTNDLGPDEPAFYKRQVPSDRAIAGGVSLVLDELQARQPQARVILMAVLPRDGRTDRVRSLNSELAALASARHADLLDLGPRIAGPDGTMRREYTVDGLHLTDAGYAVWADALLALLH